MIDRNQWSRLQGLMFTARRLVDGLYAGAHASPRRGPGVEFHDYRAYVAGDDPAGVDWKLFGRTDRHYVRQYQRYTDLHLHLLVDVSASMGFAGLDRRGRPTHSAQMPTKLDYARQLAAAIAMLAIRQGDRVGLGVFETAVREHLPMGGTWRHLHRVIAALEALKPATAVAGSDSAMGDVLRQTFALLRRRSMLVIISDLLDDPHGPDGLFDGLARFRHARSDVLVFQVLSPQEMDLRRIAAPRMRLVDTETRRQVATHIPSVADRYARLMRQHLETVRRGCIARGADHHLLPTTQPMVESLRRYLGRPRV